MGEAKRRKDAGDRYYDPNWVREQNEAGVREGIVRPRDLLEAGNPTRRWQGREPTLSVSMRPR